MSECDCWAREQCVYQGYSSCRYEYLMLELPDWYNDNPMYQDVTNLRREVLDGQPND